MTTEKQIDCFNIGDEVRLRNHTQDIWPLRVLAVLGDEIKTSDGKMWKRGNLMHAKEWSAKATGGAPTKTVSHLRPCDESTTFERGKEDRPRNIYKATGGAR